MMGFTTQKKFDVLFNFVEFLPYALNVGIVLIEHNWKTAFTHKHRVS